MIAILSHYGVTNVLTCDDLRIDKMEDWYEVTVYGSRHNPTFMTFKCSEITVFSDDGVEILSKEIYNILARRGNPF